MSEDVMLWEERGLEGAAAVRGTAGERVVHGFAAVFNKRAQLAPGIFEQIAPGAFTQAVSEDDVRFTVEHDPARLLGRTASGTLILAEQRKGLHMESPLPNTTLGKDVAELMDRGDLNGLSFRFKTPPQKERWEKLPNGNEIRTLEQLRLVDVTLTAFPAYPDAVAAIRSRDGVTELFIPLGIRKRHDLNRLLLDIGKRGSVSLGRGAGSSSSS